MINVYDKKRLLGAFVFCCICLVVLGGFAFISRCHPSLLPFAVAFFGEERSTIEHLFSGLAAPSLIFIVCAIALKFSEIVETIFPKFEANPIGLMKLSPFASASSFVRKYFYEVLLGSIAVIYIAISCQWEFGQRLERGYLQSNHIAADCIGTLLWLYCMWKIRSLDSLWYPPKGGRTSTAPS